ELWVVLDDFACRVGVATPSVTARRAEVGRVAGLREPHIQSVFREGPVTADRRVEPAARFRVVLDLRVTAAGDTAGERREIDGFAYQREACPLVGRDLLVDELDVVFRADRPGRVGRRYVVAFAEVLDLLCGTEARGVQRPEHGDSRRGRRSRRR